MLKTIASVFGLRKKTTLSNESDIINYAITVLMGTGIYASKSMTDDWPKWEKKMQSDLVMFEQYAKKFSSSTLYTLTGKGWENFSIWFRGKNDDKTTPLKQSISMFNEALKIEPDNEEAKIALASVLIERMQVRDLNYALSTLEQVKNKSGQVHELMSKAKRWSGDIKLESNFDYVSIQLIPLGPLREERKKCRTLIQNFKKEKNNKEMAKVLKHMYRLAILHDVATYVMLNTDYSIEPKATKLWDKKLNETAKNINEYSYTNNGKLIESNNCFLSNNDYKVFEMVFGETDKIFDPVSLIK